MPDFWLDTNSLIEPKDGPYGFDIAPGFWDFLKKEAREGVIASSSEVYRELKQGEEDDLLHWARQQQDEIGFFLEPDPVVQTIYREIAAYVHKTYPQHQSEAFLAGADAWIIAHAKAYGGRVVTFEKAAPNLRKAKIPDVAAHFGVNCLNVYEMVRDLGMRI